MGKTDWKSNKTVTCKKCLKQLSVKNFNRHVIEVHATTVSAYNCVACPFPFLRKRDLVKHLSSTHSFTKTEIDRMIIDIPCLKMSREMFKDRMWEARDLPMFQPSSRREESYIMDQTARESVSLSASWRRDSTLRNRAERESTVTSPDFDDVFRHNEERDNQLLQEMKAMIEAAKLHRDWEPQGLTNLTKRNMQNFFSSTTAREESPDVRSMHFTASAFPDVNFDQHPPEPYKLNTRTKHTTQTGLPTTLEEMKKYTEDLLLKCKEGLEGESIHRLLEMSSCLAEAMHQYDLLMMPYRLGMEKLSKALQRCQLEWNVRRTLPDHSLGMEPSRHGTTMAPPETHYMRR